MFESPHVRRRCCVTALLPAFLWLAGCSLWLAACSAVGSDTGDVVSGVDLDELFAPVARNEVARASAGWTGRDASARAIELVVEAQISHPFAPGWRSDVRVYGHEVDGFTHYGAVVVPTSEPERKRPVLLYLHAGDAGVHLSDVALALAVSPVIRDEYIVVVPSFRSERLEVDGAEFESDGAPSPWDRDVDDTIGLLNVAFETTPAADPDRVVVLGLSRGASVGLLTAIRDERVDGVVSFFGPTDFLGPFARDVTRDLLRNDAPNLPGIDHLNETLLQPLRRGDLGIDEVRLNLIRRSPVYFVDRLPAVQIHHGLADPIVPHAEAQALADALSEAGADHEAYFYEGGGHDPLSLSGAFDRVTTFLLQWTDPPA